MWKSLRILVEIIAELPSENRISAQAMPQTHYLNGEHSLMDEVMLLLPAESPLPESIEIEPDTLILAIQPLQNL